MNKKGFHTNIEKETLENKNFRKVLYTAAYMQLVLMSLKPGEDIGLEVHGVDQFFRFEKGKGKVIIGNNEYEVKDGDVIIVPAGMPHNVINTSETEELKLYTLYAPPHHKDGIIRETKEEAEKNFEEFDGTTTE
jgi:mannose-6-phosphate isomerase-like protein (cupin superfamily)